MKQPLLNLFSSFVFLSCLVISGRALSAEEALDLESEISPPPRAGVFQSQKFSLMGRVDLTSEFTNPSPATSPQGEGKNSLKNNHFFVFLKVKASEKTTFLGEIAQQSFFSVDYEPTAKLKIQLGKILVPFGDTRRFHHYYGGIQGYGMKGVMFPNLWAEPGFNINWHLPIGELDTYVVQSVSALDATKDPDLSSGGSTATQAEGVRWALPMGKKITGIMSAYFGEYYYGRNLLMGGLDIYSDYGALDLSFFKHTRWALGLATAGIRNSPTGSDFEKRGDYLEFATPVMSPGELRIRYGTYVNDTRVVTNKNIHNWNLGYAFSVDVIRFLIEKQWNFEAVEEYNNDVLRVMASVDF
jgi:hypothetical protein